MILLFLSSLAGGISALLPEVGQIVVVGHRRLAAVLEKCGHDVVLVAPSPGGRTPKGMTIHYLEAGKIPVDSNSVAAVVVISSSKDEEWSEKEREYTRILGDEAPLLVIAKGRAAVFSRRLLCDGMVNIQQRRFGRLVITSGNKLSCHSRLVE